MTENTLIWVDESVSYSRFQAQALANRVDSDILRPLQQLFDYVEPPGIDGDPRLYIVLIHNPNFRNIGAFNKANAQPRVVYEQSNQREMMVVNLATYEKTHLNDQFIMATVAHEYQHILLYHRDLNERPWLNEALSAVSQHYLFGFETIYGLARIFLEAPDTRLTHVTWSEDVFAHYGAGALFMIFIAEQYGYEIVGRLHAESADGWRAVDKALRESVGVSADEVFADWVLANYFLDAESGFGYHSLEPPPPTSAQPVATINEFPVLQSNRIPQYSSDYYAVDVRGADVLSLWLTQVPEAVLIASAPYEGDHFYYAVTTGSSDSRLARPIDLSQVQNALLEFRIWHDLEENYEYGYVEVSTDGGETWEILRGEHTASYAYAFHDDGYTGSSNRWLQERIDLSRYAGRWILLRFEVFSDIATSLGGMAIDDLRIDAIDYHDGFESPDDAWIAEGWIRTDNRLPQRTWLQVVQETPDGLHLNRPACDRIGRRDRGSAAGCRTSGDCRFARCSTDCLGNGICAGS